MLTGRKIVALVALLGVLLNGLLLVRHHARMVDGTMSAAVLTADLAIICSANGATRSGTDGDRGDAPAVPRGAGECPVCMGLATAAAILPGIEKPAPVVTPSAYRIAARADVIAVRMAGDRPPPRGPPAA